ncbi:MAG: sialate O-acetylesterase [Armatimonadetes bacterium]|nr:sialate O-acetylesterase [Armatimonadota bacterium]
MRHLRWLSPVVLLALLAWPARADVKLPRIFGSGMVLQTGRPVPVWGTAAPSEKVTVTFAGQAKEATAGADGAWMVKLDALPVSREGRDLTVTGANTVKYNSVLVGEVWVCSGQSNMEWTVGGVLDVDKEAADAANYPIIRHIKVNNGHAPRPVNDVDGNWTVADPGTVRGFTAVGWFFAKTISKQLNVPVGLIGSNWGGTCIETWIPPEGYRLVPELKDLAARVDGWTPTTALGAAKYAEYLTQLKAWLPLAEAAAAAKQMPPAMPAEPVSWNDVQAPTRLYNARINPLIPYAIRGAIWYQGESNGGEGISYKQKTQALVGGWRQLWGQGDFPFYWVQLANFQTSDPSKPEGGDGWSRLREAQTQACAIPNTGMACIIDIGADNDIHPRNKQDVGARLALWALAKDYGQKVEYSGPLFREMTVDGARAVLSFDHVGGGLVVGSKVGLAPLKETPDAPLKWFAIRGDDGKWYPGEAKIVGQTVVVTNAAVTKPKDVRYAFAMNPAGANLYNKEGLPAVPFRTDKD